MKKPKNIVVIPDYSFIKIFDYYRDKHGFIVYYGVDEFGKILFDINKINKKKGQKKKQNDNEILYIFHTSSEGYNHVFDPTELPDNLGILFQYKDSSNVRRWVLKRLNSLPVGNNGKTIGDFCVRSKCGYLSYDLEALNNEINTRN